MASVTLPPQGISQSLSMLSTCAAATKIAPSVSARRVRFFFFMFFLLFLSEEGMQKAGPIRILNLPHMHSCFLRRHYPDQVPGSGASIRSLSAGNTQLPFFACDYSLVLRICQSRRRACGLLRVHFLFARAKDGGTLPFSLACPREKGKKRERHKRGKISISSPS